jgi:adenylate kinase family enzyme
MLYLISGASRAGKTIMAKKILAEKGISYLSLDWLVMGFTNGIPEYGIHDKLFPDEIAERSWSFLKAMLESMIYVDADCVVEGEALLPELIVELREKYPDNLRVCFIGYTDVTVDEKVKDIKKFSFGKSDWLIDKSDEYIIDHVKNMITHSKIIKESCKENDLRYFDTSKNFMDVLENTKEYLLG